MSLFSFLNKKTNDQYLFDIKGESISCTVFRLLENDKPEVLFFKNVFFGDSIKLGIKKYVSAMYNSLEKVSQALNKEYLLDKKLAQLDEVHFVVSSPWILSQVKNINVKSGNRISIDDKFINNLLINESEKVSNELFADGTSKAFKIFEKQIVQSRLDGYKIENIFNKKCSEVFVNMFVSFIQSEMYEKIVSIVAKNVLVKKNTFHSFSLSSFSFVRDLYPAINDFVVLDIGGETTEVVMTYDDMMSKVFSFPFGRRTIIEKISTSLSVPDHMATSLLNMTCKGTCDVITTERVEKALDLALSEWAKNFSDILKELSPKNDNPKDIYIIVGDEIGTSLARKLGSKKYIAKDDVDNDYNIALIDERKFSQLIKRNEVVTSDIHSKFGIILLSKIIKR